MTSKKQKSTAFNLILGAFLSNQSTSSAIFTQISRKIAQISLTSPKRTKKWPPRKKASALLFWAPFFKIQSTPSDFAKIFTHFVRISTDFARILAKSNFWGCACTPWTPTSYTTAISIGSIVKVNRLMKKFLQNFVIIACNRLYY